MANLVDVKVYAVGVNRADILQLEGKYKPPDGSLLPGLELSGVRLDTGEKICALVAGGAYAKTIKVDERLILNVDPEISFITAASLPQALVCTWLNLFKLNLNKNFENVLIHGGGSGVCSTMVQFAAIFFKQVYTTAQTLDKLDYCKSIKNCYPLTYDNFFKTLHSNVEVNYLIDILGGDLFGQNLKLLARNATMIIFAVMRGKISEINLARVLMKNIKLIGSTLRQKTIAEKSVLLKEAYKNLMKYIRSGQVTPVIDKVFNLENFTDAHAYLKTRKNTGKIILKV